LRFQTATLATTEPHTIPLSTAAQNLLASVPRIAGSDYVFTKSGNAPINSWSKPKIKLDEVSGVSDWRIHDLRRTTATGMQRLGIGPQTIEAVLGHVGAKSGIIQVYQRHTSDTEKRAASKHGASMYRA
jgi:integrase